jgi:glycosyltransferase involved in cell wall biosynthesis
MSTALVTVGVPTYQRSDFLPEALESILGQTLEDIEVIVSDNGMSEEVRAFVESFGDPRLTYRHNGANIGSTPNTVAACLAGSAPYVAVLHDDDVWEPKFLETLVSQLEADPTLSMAFSDLSIIMDDGTHNEQLTVLASRAYGRNRLSEGKHQPFYDIALLDRAVQSPGVAVVRRSAIDWADFPPEMNPMYDTWLAYLACREGRGAWFTPDRLVRYRTHPGTLSRNNRWNQQFIWMYTHFVHDDRLAAIRPALERALARFHLLYATDLLADGDKRQARREVLTGFRRARTARGLATLLLASIPGRAEPRVELARRISRKLDRRAV